MLIPLKTEDNSFTLFHPELNESYHSRKGALTESLHVYIENGLKYVLPVSELHVLEVGFGTGLNAYLTMVAIENHNVKVSYTALEPFILSVDTIKELKLESWVPQRSDAPSFHKFYEDCISNSLISNDFKVYIEKLSLADFSGSKPFDLMYFDAFAPHAQPEMWDLTACQKLANFARIGTVLVTYCAQAQFKRNMRASGWAVEALPGPPGKREMTRAVFTGV